MLKKLSLAALIAMGSMSVASATPLTEAIKGVDLSGMLRIRYYHEMPKDQNSMNGWRTNGIFIFKVPVDENIKLVYRASVQTFIKSDDDTAKGVPTDNNLKTLAINDVDTGTMNNLLFMAYSNNGFNAIIGKIPVKTSITSADPATPGHGAGVVATYTVNKNLTVAAGYVDALRHTIDTSGKHKTTSKYIGGTLPNDIYTAAAIFDAGIVKGQIWAYKVTNLSDGIYTVTLNATPVEGVNAQVDYGHGKNQGTGVKSSNYYDVVLSGNMDQFGVTLGYAYHNDGNSIIITADDAPFGNVITTANNYNIAGASKKISSIFGKIGVNVDAKTNLYVAYQHQNDKSTANNDLDEYTVGAKYAYNKKLSFSGYYDYSDFKINTNDNGEVRLEALYKF